MRTVCAVLAAGSSARLGTPKQLVEFEGEPLIRRAARTALEAGCDETLVVVCSGEVIDAIDDLPLRIVFNGDAAEGMSSSIRTAVELAEKSRILFTTCDQPRVTSAHLRDLLGRNSPIVATGYSGIAGIPAVFAPELAEALLDLRGDRGARGVIEANAGQTLVVPFEDAAFDVDTPDDYLRL